MESIAQVSRSIEHILNEEANALARSTGFVPRERVVSGADFAQGLSFGWWQEPSISLDGQTQVLSRREVSITASGLSQRFTPQGADFLKALLHRLTCESLQVAPVPVAMLQPFSAVVREDSRSIVLPQALASVWHGCGGSTGMSEASLKLFVRWDVLRGQLAGPWLTQGRRNDHRSPWSLESLPEGSLYGADLGFFSLERFCRLCGRQRGRHVGKKATRSFVSRWWSKAKLWDRHGHPFALQAHLPMREGQRVQLQAMLGHKERLAGRLLLERVPPEVAEQRRQRIREAAAAHGRHADERTLLLADWTILITNVPQRLLSFEQVLVIVRLRWQIERLFRLWKADGLLDEWRSKQPWRILCELYAKLCAMVLQAWLIQLGCWQDIERSIVKAAQVCRREAGRLMVALYEGSVELVVRSMVRCMQSGCRINHRQALPSTAQL